jgi:uncharacterized linocin/CFP29 family protein
MLIRVIEDNEPILEFITQFKDIKQNVIDTINEFKLKGVKCLKVYYLLYNSIQYIDYMPVYVKINKTSDQFHILLTMDIITDNKNEVNEVGEIVNLNHNLIIYGCSVMIEI